MLAPSDLLKAFAEILAALASPLGCVLRAPMGMGTMSNAPRAPQSGTPIGEPRVRGPLFSGDPLPGVAFAQDTQELWEPVE